MPWLLKSALLGGLICFAPITCVDWRAKPTLEDASIALRPLVRIPLESMRKSGESSILCEIPSTKMLHEWGSPIYVIFWESPEGNLKMMRSFSVLQLSIAVFVNDLRATLKSTISPPYGYSSDCSTLGYEFSAHPGDRIRIEFRALIPDKLPSGVLVVSPSWSVPIKDRLVGIDVQHDFYRIARIMAWIGTGLLSIACIRSFVGFGK